MSILISLVGLSAEEDKVDYNVIPMPKEVVVDSTAEFVLKDGMGLAFDASDEEMYRNALFLRQWVREVTGIELKLTPNDAKAAVRMSLGAPAEKEGYLLTVSKKGINIQANDYAGLFRAAQTLRKSLPIVKEKVSGISLPYVTINDYPRFEYRGVLLDCGRHFFTVEFIKKFIDVLALHGCNQLHWHLTEDQGWRFEVKAYPSLAPMGSVRKETVIGHYKSGVYDGVPYGGYYTQDDCREIVRYAAERYINVVPEIDLPGHMQSALHVFPHLGCTGGPYPVRTNWGVSHEILCGGNPETLIFLKTVLGELCDVFPSKYIHIGGDECRKTRWSECPKCQAKIKELGLVDDGKHKFSKEHQLQS